MWLKSSRWSLRDLFGFKKSEPLARRAKTRYHAVSIVPGPHTCAAAHRLVGQRFLSSQAPPLPLPSCDAFHCACRFKEHKDRRAGPRRRSDIGLMADDHPVTERRRSRGRRSGDLEDVLPQVTP